MLPVLRCEAEVLMEIIKRELDLICPGCQLVLQVASEGACPVELHSIIALES